MASETAALVGVRLRAARAEKDWTRRRLASEMDGLATDNDIYRWETGKHRPRDDALAAAARALEKPLAYFLGGPQPAPTPDPFRANGNGNGHATIDDVLAEVQALRDATQKRYDALDVVLRAILGYWQAARGETKPLPTTLAETQALLDWAQEQERIALRSRGGEDRQAGSG